jgi:catechol 2,3-dioxygenase-like lactoylglutathione lyase family enzyme
MKFVPSLLTCDLAETVRFYSTIGFAVCGEGVDTGWVELRHGELALQFYTDPPIGTPDTPIMSGTIYVHTSDIDTLVDAWRDRLKFEWGPETMEYGMREFAFRDPNGYIVAFAAPLP